ncbi:inositol 3-kinase [Selaginella moellendorffii]|uniref:inositol 3-kinase n=1 Tax=Selaginella moellendorffii TaxID=88036 RepID=UPI000D1C5DC2|nr:inositol 3-kinase [Selaginella moellendorffii]|eukprot:XP_024520934.1 inositol 3-kinase [Selaginella moellendorffii]
MLGHSMDEEDDGIVESNGCDGPGLAGPILIVGNYCHDTIITRSSRTDTLGGSAGYLVNVLDALGVESEVISKVGPDFAYRSRVSHPPVVVERSATTHFVADYTGAEDEDRVLRAVKMCDPIVSSDFGGARRSRYGIGLAAGVAGEILPEALERIIKLCDRVIVDLQALIRLIDPVTGVVKYRKLEDTEFYGMLDRVSFVKAAQSEAKYIDLENARQKTCVIVTNGDKGSTVYIKSNEYHVPAFPASELDPTGAGDSFLGGFTAGLYRGLSVEKAVVVGNYFGALAVSHVGIPTLTQFQVKDSDKLFSGNDCRLA